MLRLSLIIATYNRSESLLTALQSVVEQDAPKSEWECVVVNNNSTDDTESRFAEFAATHPDVQLRMVKEQRQGLSYARNRGIGESEGEYIAIIDDDERIAPEFISSYIALFDSTPDAVAAGGLVIHALLLGLNGADPVHEFLRQGVFVLFLILRSDKGIRRIILLQIGIVSFGTQAALDEVAKNGHDQREDRHADQHTGNAEDVSHHGNGDDNAERGEAGAVTQDRGGDDVAIDLLYHKDQQSKEQHLGRIDDKDDDARGDRTDEGAEEGDKVGDADDNGDQYGEGDIEDQEQDKTGQTHKRGVDHLADQITTDLAVCLTDIIEHALFPRIGEDGAKYAAAACVQSLLGEQHIYRDEDTDNDIGQRAHAAAQYVPNGRKGVAEIEIRQRIGIAAADTADDAIQLRLQEGDQLIQQYVNIQ